MRIEYKLWIYILIFIIGIGIGATFSAISIYQNKGKDEQTTIETYNIGDKLTINLADDLEKEFYVISQDGEKLTLISTDIIGTTQYNNNYKDGNEFEDSLIETKLKELTSTWKNPSKIRLITIEELDNTGETEVIGSCEGETTCDEIETKVKDNSWISLNEPYWTMSQVYKNGANTNYYVYLVTTTIKSNLVGALADSKWGTQEYGIRPVIEIDIKYVK